MRPKLCRSKVFGLVLARPSLNKLICPLAVCSFVVKWRQNMLFLTNELAKKAEITILSARNITRPGLQAGASWVERKGYIRGSAASDSHLGL